MAAPRIAVCLLFCRLSVFLVMLMWTIDKFVNPEHAIKVFDYFYYIDGLTITMAGALGAIELLILLGFVAGYKKFWTYGAVLVFHSVSTLSSFSAYLNPWDGSHLLFFAAWPMLAACFTLFYLRDMDNLCTVRR